MSTTHQKLVSFAAWGWCGFVVTIARANINLEWRPGSQTVNVGDTVRVGLYAVSDSTTNQSLSAMNMILAWDPLKLRLIAVDDAGGAALSFSGFPADPYHLNESDPPQDGDGLYVAFAELGDVVLATPAGTLISTFVLEALAQTPQTRLAILEEAGNPPGQTIVYDGEHPNRDVTGTLGSADVRIESQDCPSILDHVVKFHRGPRTLVTRVRLSPPAERGGAVGVVCTGPSGEQSEVARIHADLSARFEFLAVQPGEYVIYISETADRDGNTQCVGRFAEVRIQVR